MPTNDLKDSSGKSLPFVALNTNKASGVREDRQVRAGSWLCYGHLKPMKLYTCSAKSTPKTFQWGLWQTSDTSLCSICRKSCALLLDICLLSNVAGLATMQGAQRPL